MTTPAKEYTNTASVAVLSIPITATDLTATVTNFLGWPTPVDGVWAIIGRGTTSAEVILVTNVAGAILSIERGQDGTVAMPHSAGDLIEHIAPAVHFSNAEEHQAATNHVHGINSPLAGIDDPATLTNKLYRGAFLSVHSDAQPPAITSRYESRADAPGADGYVHRNVAGDPTARGYLLEQAGTPRFQVFNDGRVKIAAAGVPGLENATASKLDGDITAGANVTVTGNVNVPTGAVTASDLTATDDVVVGDALTVTGLSTLGVTHAGALTATSAAVTGTLSATGTATLAAVNAASVAATGAVTAATVTATGAVSGATVAATGVVTAYGGRAAVTVGSLASVTSPTTGQLAFLTTDNMLYRWTGSAWLAVLHTDAAQGHARYTNAATQNQPAANQSMKVYLPTVLASTADVTATVGTVTTGSYFTLNRAGLWQIDGGITLDNGTGFRDASVGDDVAGLLYSSGGSQNSAASPFDLPVATCRRFNAGQRIALWMFSDTACNIISSNERTHFSLTWLRP